tara:strand:- start:50 stop:394 length:345 start_codon:yes stop_codon:yes gene_type:complete
MSAQGSQLAQTRPSGTSAAAAFTATVPTEITRIFIANTTGSTAAFSIFHDDDGSTFDQTTALFSGVSINGNTTTEFSCNPGAGIQMRPDGKLAVQTDTGSALTFSIYGITAQVE